MDCLYCAGYVKPRRTATALVTIDSALRFPRCTCCILNTLYGGRTVFPYVPTELRALPLRGLR